jgi:acetyl-CoA/propionyl-CoA carboxylase carboxyl transferase subunit
MSLPAIEPRRVSVDRARTHPVDNLQLLVDRGSLRLAWPRGGILVGSGLIHGSPARVFATDPSIYGGTLGIGECDGIVATIEAAVKDKVPVIGVWHSGGARLHDDPVSLHSVGMVFAAMVAASGRVPQLSVVLGPAAGGAAYGPALGDIIVMGPAARIFVTGPEVVRAATGEAVDAESLGGQEVHGRLSGVAHAVTTSDAEAFKIVRRLTRLLNSSSQSCHSHQGAALDDPGIASVLPESSRRAYDVHALLDRFVDHHPEGNLVELHSRWARNIVTALGMIEGKPVGIVANNPLHRAGCLDAASGDKAARFVRLCDSFGVPMLVVVDVPGYLPGAEQERDAVVRRGAKLLHAFAESRVPRVTVITRKAYGGACIAMNSLALGATAVFAWPDAQIGVMTGEAAVGVLHRRRLADVSLDERSTLRAQLAADHDRSHGAERALQSGMVTAIIDPATTRRRVAAVFASTPPTRGHHGNIPL